MLLLKDWGSCLVVVIAQHVQDPELMGSIPALTT